MKLIEREKDIERDILIYLNSLDDVFAWKNNSVGVFDPVKKVYRKPKSKFLINGVADVICIKKYYKHQSISENDNEFIQHGPLSKVLFLEVKTSIGKQTKPQKYFEDNIKLLGGNYYIVRTIDDVKEVLLIN